VDLPLIGSLDWQTLAAIACVIAAAAEVAKRALGWLNGSTRSACSSCPAKQSKPVVPISSLKLSDSLKERTAKGD
jgi:hypothetical protein